MTICLFLEPSSSCNGGPDEPPEVDASPAADVLVDQNAPIVDGGVVDARVDATFSVDASRVDAAPIVDASLVDARVDATVRVDAALDFVTQ